MPILFAAIAALAGMTTCRYTFGFAVRAVGNSTQPGPHSYTHPSNRIDVIWRFLTLLSPFLLGGVVAAVAYLALHRILAALPGTESRWSAANATLAQGDSGSSAAAQNEPKPATGPIAILLIVVAISALIPAGIVALLPRSGFGDMSAVAMIGAGFGLLIGIPAALIVWLATRRRPDVTSDVDQHGPKSSK